MFYAGLKIVYESNILSYLPCPTYLETFLSLGPEDFFALPHFLFPNTVLIDEAEPVDFAIHNRLFLGLCDKIISYFLIHRHRYNRRHHPHHPNRILRILPFQNLLH